MSVCVCVCVCARVCVLFERSIIPVTTKSNQKEESRKERGGEKQNKTKQKMETDLPSADPRVSRDGTRTKREKNRIREKKETDE